MKPINLSGNFTNKRQKLALGIDFGTTNSVACVVSDKAHKVLTINGNSNLLPSILYFGKNNKILFANNISDINISDVNILDVCNEKKSLQNKDIKNINLKSTTNINCNLKDCDLTNATLKSKDITSQDFISNDFINHDFIKNGSISHDFTNNNFTNNANVFGKNLTNDSIEDENILNRFIKVSSLKRLIGQNLEDIKRSEIHKNLIPYLYQKDDILYFSAFGHNYSITQLISLFFSHLKNQIEDVLKNSICECVISVPAYFNSHAKGIIINAAKIAGLSVLRLIAEPTAAAYAYKLNTNKASGTYLVYDLGGGTFDASVIDIKNKLIKVRGVTGNNMLGGDDIDCVISKYIIEKHDINQVKALELAKHIKESIKEDKDQICITSSYANNMLLNKQDIFQLISPIINTTVRLVKNLVLEQEISELDGIILVGGSTKLCFIRQELKKLSYPILDDINPDESVAIGAAYQANDILNEPKNTLIDVAPLSIGIELADGLVEKIISKNTPLPFTNTVVFTTAQNNQKGMKFNVVQGEREFAKDNISLAKFELKDITPKNAGHSKIHVRFCLDINSILSISTFDEDSGSYEDIVINPLSDLSDEVIQNHLDFAIQNINKDHVNRKVQVYTNKIQKLMDALDPIIHEDTNHAQDVIHNMQNRVQSALQNKNLKKIEEEFEEFESFVLPILEKNINASIAKNIVGKKI